MKLKEKLKALGFEEVYEHGEYLNKVNYLLNQLESILYDSEE